MVSPRRGPTTESWVGSVRDFGPGGLRHQAADLARATGSRLIQLRCTLEPIIAVRRIARRREAGGDPSDADAVIAARMAAHCDPWPEATAIDTAADIRAVMGAARAQLDDDTEGSAASEVGCSTS